MTVPLPHAQMQQSACNLLACCRYEGRIVQQLIKNAGGSGEYKEVPLPALGYLGCFAGGAVLPAHCLCHADPKRYMPACPVVLLAPPSSPCHCHCHCHCRAFQSHSRRLGML